MSYVMIGSDEKKDALKQSKDAAVKSAADGANLPLSFILLGIGAVALIGFAFFASKSHAAARSNPGRRRRRRRRRR